MKLKITIIAFLLCSFSANALEKQTLLYSTKGDEALYLDLYQVDNPKGCVIYAFGGGFYQGARDEERFIPYFQFLNQEGYTVASISYRLGLKNITKDISPTQYAPTLINTIENATEDLLSATLFVLEHADEWGIDKSKIIASGSSSGAIISLQAAYEISIQSKLSSILPENFNYAGIMSFAGAILSVGSIPIWQRPPCPLLLFHGDADTYVPFNSVGILCTNLYGSNYIVNQIKSLNTPYYFYYPENVDHDMASLPLSNYHEEIAYFLHEYIEQGRRLQITYKIEDLELPEKPDKYTLMDFVKSLMGHVK